MDLNTLRSAEGRQSARWTRDTALVSGAIPAFFPHDLGYWRGALEHDARYVVHGRWLCDICGDAMTNDIVTPAESPTGEEIAVCSGCRGAGRL